MNSTIEYYEKNASAYIAKTFSIDMSDVYQRFLEQVPPDAESLLDVGCGAGRDIVYFQDHFQSVWGIEPCKPLADFARGLNKKGGIIEQPLERVTWGIGEFSAIWCCSSLCHLNMDDFNKAMDKFSKLLSKEGVLYLSMKQGWKPHWDKDDRFFNNMTDAMVLGHINARDLSCEDLWMSAHGSTIWVNAVAVKL